MRAAKLMLLVAGLGALTLSGCAAQRTKTAADNRISLDPSPAYAVVLAPMTSVTVSDARVDREGEFLVVSGRVKRMHEVRLPGHLDLAICGPDGALLAKETTRILGLASKRKGAMELPFRFRPALVPPEGATIRLQYHAPAAESMELGCSKS